MAGLAQLVIAVHGTRSAVGTQTSLDLVAAVQAELPAVDVRIGWVDIHTPTLADTLRSLGEAIVVPVFLTDGYHVGSDIPAAIAQAGGRSRATNRIGTDVLPVVVERLSAVAAEAGGPDAVVLAAAGSRRPRAVSEVHEAAAALSRLIGRPVRAAYVTSATPSPFDAVAELRREGHRRVVVASYLLAPGQFQSSLATAGADAVTDPIGTHPLLVECIVDRYVDVLAGAATRQVERQWQPRVVND